MAVLFLFSRIHSSWVFGNPVGDSIVLALYVGPGLVPSLAAIAFHTATGGLQPIRENLFP